MDEDWDDEQLAALDAAEAAVSSSSSSRNDNDIASPQDIRDALQRRYSAIERPLELQKYLGSESDKAT